MRIARKEKREEKKLSEGTGGRGEQSQQEEHIPHPAEDSHHDQNATSRPLLKARVSPCLENDEKPVIKLDDSDDDSFNAVREQGTLLTMVTSKTKQSSRMRRRNRLLSGGTVKTGI